MIPGYSVRLGSSVRFFFGFLCGSFFLVWLNQFFRFRFFRFSAHPYQVLLSIFAFCKIIFHLPKPGEGGCCCGGGGGGCC
ncbi:hypothetical protein Hanom_Chr01g00090361 [Helianthus anomalus]